ncbi:hypothetical protein [Streptomyces sp. JJ38]|uniref:hypothetical protein n=1 Tax=Streptomyces sp. JJ38 TaxID=2738128 RepID=UPI001C58B867|nr:hypothetical protein [Streptomyces sp. JJ38]MBW1597822.1 hypothetical protein [Streptomyces sp. JJ38]
MTLDPRCTLAIVCGADSWPNLREFEDTEAFRTTATAFRDYLTGEHLGLPDGHVLWLFGKSGVPQHLDEIVTFLAAAFGDGSPRGGGWTVLFFYTGHGFFLSSPNEYHLALHDTRSPMRADTSLRASSLGQLLREVAPDSDRVLVVDACFAAAAVPYMQASLDDVVGGRVQTVLDKEPAAGPGSVAVLCASDRNTWAELDGSLRWTTFVRSLLDVLTGGLRGAPAALSLYDVCAAVAALQRSKGAPKPEVHVPVQAAGDLSRVPLFPNPAAGSEQPPPGPPEPPVPPPGPRPVPPVAERVARVLSTQPERLVRQGYRLSSRLAGKVSEQCDVRSGEKVNAVCLPLGRVEWFPGSRLIVFTDQALYLVTAYGRLRCPYGRLSQLGLSLSSMRVDAGFGRFVIEYAVDVSLGDEEVKYGNWGKTYAQQLYALLTAVRATTEG